MEKNVQKIVNQINELVDELAQIAISSPIKKSSGKHKIANRTKGAVGGLNILIDEGYFDKPKDLSSILNKLQEIGRYYPRPSIAMNLLNLTKRRMLTRIRNKNSKSWQYVIHK